MTDTQRRQQILKKIYRVPSDKLEELDDFVFSNKVMQGLKARK